MNNKKHILFISSWYPQRSDPTHGIFNRYFAEASSLYNRVSVLHVCSDEKVAKGVEVVTSEDGEIFTVRVYYKKAGRLNLLKKYRRVLQAYNLGFKEIIKKTGRPDLIQLNVIMPAGAGVLHLSKKYGIPLVINENWSGYTKEDGNYKSFIQRYFTKKIISRAKAIMPTSEYLKEAMLSHGLKGNYFVIPNVVNVKRFTPSVDYVKDETTLIHISSLNDREKNVSGIIRAFSSAAEVVPGLRLNVVGEGADKKEYQSMVADLGLTNRIKFKGRLLADELVQEVNASDALIMFSNYETFCLVIIEAFACGKPVITSNAGAIAGYMKPELGIMVNKADEEALKTAIISFVGNRNKYDHEYIRNFAVNNYSYEKIGKKLNDIYTFALGGERPKF